METRILHRKNVIDTLTDAVNRHHLVVVTAPMGYGKTTAAREALRHMGRRIFYVTINPGPHNALYLWDRACGQLAAQGSGMAAGLQSMGFPADNINLQRTLQKGREYLAGRPTLLVVDDYHHVNSAEVDRLIEAMVREEMPGLCVMLLSREKPPLPTEELCLKGLAAVFDKDLLTFSQEDADRFFRLHGIDNRDAAQTAWNFSEGWAAALWLGLQSYRTHGVLASSRTVNSLLESVVYARYDEMEQCLLLQLSILSSFSPRQAAAVCDDPAAPRRLSALHEKNAFLNYDPTTDNYRLHSLFRGYLASLLDDGEYSPARGIDKAALARRAGRWFAAEGDHVQAMRFFAAAGTDDDHLEILRIFEKPSDGLWVMFDLEGVTDIVAAIPWSVRMLCPIGYLAFIYHVMSRAGIARAMPLLLEAERRFAGEPGLGPDMQRLIQGEIALIRGIDAFNDLFAMRDAHKKAHELLGGRSAISHRHLIWTFGSPHAAFLYVRRAGTYTDMVNLVESDLRYYHDLADGCGMGAQELFRAELLLEQGAFKKVEPHIMKSIYRASGKQQLATIIAANFSLARLHLARGEAESGVALLRELGPEVIKRANPLLRNSLDMSLGYIAACLGHLDAVPRWLKDGDISIVRSFYQGISFSQVAHGKAVLLKKDWNTLETLAQDIPSHMTRYPSLFALIHAAMLESVAAYHLYGIAEGAAALRRAVDLARQDGIALCIAEYGRHCLPMLKALAARNPGDIFLRTLLRLTRHYGQMAAAGHGEAFSIPSPGTERRSSDRRAAAPSPMESSPCERRMTERRHQPPKARTKNALTEHALTEREKLLLSLAAKGESNAEIAARLGVSLPAVKKAFSAVYRKLGVRGRVEAVGKMG